MVLILRFEALVCPIQLNEQPAEAYAKKMKTRWMTQEWSFPQSLPKRRSTCSKGIYRCCMSWLNRWNLPDFKPSRSCAWVNAEYVLFPRTPLHSQAAGTVSPQWQCKIIIFPFTTQKKIGPKSPIFPKALIPSRPWRLRLRVEFPSFANLIVPNRVRNYKNYIQICYTCLIM